MLYVCKTQHWSIPLIAETKKGDKNGSDVCNMKINCIICIASRTTVNECGACQRDENEELTNDE